MRKVALICMVICSVLLAGCATSRKVAELESALQQCNQTVEQAYEDCRSVVAAYDDKLAEYEERLAAAEGLPLYWYEIEHGIPESVFTPSGNDCVRVIADVVPLQSGAMTDEQILKLANHVIEDIVLEKEVNAICLFFWASKDSRDRREYARGCVDWGPGGNFDNAEKVETGDYSQHSYRVVFNWTSEPITVRPRLLLESTRKNIFYAAVALQDQIGDWDPQYQEKQERAKKDIARKYGISMSELGSIIKQGAQEGWPTPKPP